MKALIKHFLDESEKNRVREREQKIIIKTNKCLVGLGFSGFLTPHTKHSCIAEQLSLSPVDVYFNTFHQQANNTTPKKWEK